MSYIVMCMCTCLLQLVYLLDWESWLEKNFEKLRNPTLELQSEKFIDKYDTKFYGTVTHGLARSCISISREDLRNILSKMPEEHLNVPDVDEDLPIHSAIQSKSRTIDLFVRGDEVKKILCARNKNGKTPIELAFDHRHREAIEFLFNKCVDHQVLTDLTGIGCRKGPSDTLLHKAFDRDDMTTWPWFLEIVVEACKKANQKILPVLQIPNKRYGYTPFKYLMNCMHPKDPSSQAKLKYFEKVLVILNSNDIDLQSVYTDPSSKRTMLHAAKRKHYEECSKMLENYNHQDVADEKGIRASQRDHHIQYFYPLSTQ